MECDDYSSSEVNEIPNSLTPTHFHSKSQKEIMHVGSNVAPTEIGLVVATEGQLSLPDIDSHGNLFNLTFHHQSLHAADNNHSRRDANGDDGRNVSEAYDGSAGAVKVSQSSIQRRVKVSEPLHPSECEANAYDEEI